MELLLKAEAAEAGGSATAAPASAPASPGAEASEPLGGEQWSQGGGLLRGSRLLRAGRLQQAAGCGGAAGSSSPRRRKTPPASEPAERIVSLLWVWCSRAGQVPPALPAARPPPKPWPANLAAAAPHALQARKRLQLQLEQKEAQLGKLREVVRELEGKLIDAYKRQADL